MKVLVVAQNSKLSKVIGESCTQANGHTIWADTGLPVQYPISLAESNRRAKIWVKGKTTWIKTFDQICEMFPDFVWELPVGSKASWGTGLYVQCANGFPMLMDSDWDTSD
jgi:hypothetical protein